MDLTESTIETLVATLSHDNTRPGIFAGVATRYLSPRIFPGLSGELQKTRFDVDVDAEGGANVYVNSVLHSQHEISGDLDGLERLALRYTSDSATGTLTPTFVGSFQALNTPVNLTKDGSGCSKEKSNFGASDLGGKGSDSVSQHGNKKEVFDLGQYQVDHGRTYTADDGRLIFEHDGRWVELIAEDSCELVGRALAYNHLTGCVRSKVSQWVRKRTNLLEHNETVEGKRWPHATVEIVNTTRKLLILERDDCSMLGPVPLEKQCDYSGSAATGEEYSQQGAGVSGDALGNDLPNEGSGDVLQTVVLDTYVPMGKVLKGRGRSNPRYRTARDSEIELYPKDQRIGLPALLKRRLSGDSWLSNKDAKEILEGTDLYSHGEQFGDTLVLPTERVNQALVYLADSGHLKTE